MSNRLLKLVDTFAHHDYNTETQINIFSIMKFSNGIFDYIKKKVNKDKRKITR